MTQETLEEYFLGKMKEVLLFDNDAQAIRFMEKYFEAKWQQERSYSDEEVEDLIYKVCGTVARLQEITLNGNHIDSAYKQFKKK